ncbi:MAG: DUF4139 domain-containing protein [Planctomycetota bacterium]|jgi:hypothetical protein
MTVETVPSRIDGVTVYRSGARIQRVGEIEGGEDGFPEFIRVSNLPLALHDDSLRVRLEPLSGADEGTLPAAVDLRVGLGVPAPDENLAPPKDEQLEEARAEVRKLEEEVERIRQALERIEGLDIRERPPGKRGEPPPPSPTGARLSLLRFRREEIEKRLEKLREIEKTLRKAHEKLDELEFRHALASSAKQAREHELRKAAVVRLRVEEGVSSVSKARIVVEYTVPGARWAPSYALRFDPGYGRARLQIRATVCQRSGEDWENAELSLSTADVLNWTDLPDLPSLRIGKRQALPARPGWREAPTGAEALYSDWDRARAASPMPSPQPSDDTRMKEVLRDEDTFLADAEEELDDDMWGAGMEEVELAEEAPPEAQMYVSAAAMPPPAPGAAPPSASQAVGHGPLGKLAKKEMEMSKRRRPAARSGFGGGKAKDDLYAPQGDPASGGELSARSDLLRYGRLRLRGPAEAGRGKLGPLSPSAMYDEMLAEGDARGGGDVAGWVRAAVHSASTVSDVPLPLDHVHPFSVDGFDYAYSSRGRVDVPSDGAFHSLPVLEEGAQTRLRFVCVPREVKEVFRFITFTNPLESPLLAGPADIYVGGDFSLTSVLKTVAPRGEVEVGLGAEESVKVARNARFEEHASGLLGGQINLVHEILVDVTNHLDKVAEVEVRERIPTVRKGDDEIEVEVEETDPPWEEWKQERSPIRGSFRWRVRLDPGAQRSLKAKYSVHLSSKKQLSGGNRREQ